MTDEQVTSRKTRSELAAAKRLEAAQAKLEKLQAAIDAAKQAKLFAAEKLEKAKKAAKVNSKDVTRKKILIGALMLQRMESDARLQSQIMTALEKTLTRPIDRELFGFDSTVTIEDRRTGGTTGDGGG